MGDMPHRRLDRLHDGGHGADQPAESFGRPGFAGDDRPLGAVAFG
jgi:hypothetical protein